MVRFLVPISLARLGFPRPRLGALQRRLLGADALVEIDRVHFAEQLSRFDRLPHLHRQAFQASRRRWADLVAVAGFLRADAEESRRDAPFFHRRHRHRHRRQRPAAQGDVNKKGEQWDEHRQEGQGAGLHGQSHGLLPMSR